jgi:organic hydroperoxide reductase OsmC/OhrA
MPTMEATETTSDSAPPKVRHKSFTYRTASQWTSGRSGVVTSEGKHAVLASSPPEFKGEPGRWTPEDLFVAAIDLCTMTTFTAFAQRLKIPVISYQSEAEGTLEFVDDGYRFTRVVLRPRIMVAEPAAVATAEKAMHDAHESCLVARSVRAEVTIEPTIGVASPDVF